MRHSFVHLSDIHFGQEKSGSVVIHNDVRDELVKDVRTMSTERGRASRIIITGDIAYSGKQDQYQKAVPWLEELTQAAKCKETEVSCIPGNHDCDLATLTTTMKSTYEHLRTIPATQATEQFNAIVEDGESGSPFLPKLKAYRNFANGFGCDFEELEKKKRAAWVRDFDLPHGVKLRFHGLTSVQLSNLDDQVNSMFLGKHQYTIKEEPNAINVVLCHHPLDWFIDENDTKNYLENRARVLMFGHEHKSNAEKRNNAFTENEWLVLSAAATNPPDADYDYAYNWIEFSCVEEGDKSFLVVEIFPRVWVKERAQFDADRKLVKGGAESVQVKIECKNVKFDPAAREAEVAAGEDSVSSTVAAPASSAKETKTTTQGGSMTDAKIADFDKLRYMFWRYLSWQQRLEVLVQARALPKTAEEPIPQVLERKALEQAAADPKKLQDIWDAVMQAIPEAKRQENPFRPKA